MKYYIVGVRSPSMGETYVRVEAEDEFEAADLAVFEDDERAFVVKDESGKELWWR